MTLRVLSCLCIVLATSAWGQEDILNLADSSNDFAAHLSHGHWSLGKGHPTFNSSGNPNVILKRSEGLKIEAKSLSGTYTVKKDGKYNMDRLLAEGSVDLHYDSDLARSYQVKNGLKPTDAPGITTELQSESILLNQTPDDDMATLTQPFTLSDNRPGKNKNGPVLSASKATGSSGIFHFSIPEKKGGKGKLKTADIQGPVHYHLVQTTIDPDTKKPVVATYDVVADHLTADMTDPDAGKIDLDGHITWSRISELDSINGICKHMTLTADAEGEVTDFSATSNDITAQPKPEKKQ